MDRYILSKLKIAVTKIDQAMEDYNTPLAVEEFSGFFEALNNWYIRRNRERFWRKEIDADKAKKPKAFDWKSSQKLMKDPQAFMTALLSFKEVVNQNEIPPANVAVVKKDYLSNPEFDPHIIENKSKIEWKLS